MARNRTKRGEGRLAVVVDLALALHRCDTSAHRLEGTVRAVGLRLGLRVECFASPTALFIGVGDEPARMLRVEPAQFDGEALVAVDGVARDLLAGRVAPAAARRRLKRLKARPPLAAPVSLLAFAVVSASASVLLGGTPLEALAAAGLGLIAGAVGPALGPHPAARRLAALATAALVAAAAAAMASRLPVAPERATLAALIVLVPGLSLTLALSELSEGHLVSGTARLAAVAVSFLQLGLGAGIGWAAASVLGPGPAIEEAGSPQVAHVLALAVAPPAIAVLMRVRAEDVPALAGATWLGVLGARFGASFVGPEAGALLGAFVVGLASNAYARRAAVPSPVVMVPGILLLVPGSVGFRGFAALLQEETLRGVEAAFAALLLAACLVGGLLAAHALLPEAPPVSRRRPRASADAPPRGRPGG